MISPGGAGRGDPYARDPDAVLRDLRAGRVTLGRRRRDYGVAIDDDAIDTAETARLRAAPRSRPAFAAGAFRLAHEARWDAEAYATLHDLLATLPVSWRAPTKTRLFAAVRAEPDRCAAAILREAFARLAEGRG